MPESVSLEIGGRTAGLRDRRTCEASQRQPPSSATATPNVVLAAVTASEKPREGIDFFPLTCDFEEKMYAAGKIPGGYIKREGRPSEHGVLARASDRSPDPPALPRRLPQRRADHRDGALDRSGTRRRRARACAPPAPRSPSPTSRSRRTSPRCASDATKTGKFIMQSDAAAIRNRRHGHRRRRHVRRA